ncbi:MAG: DUF2207 domain-containing protein [Betaproteobacteria bacterium]|nr:DUF2207 domain-containing protein [Betaproteobacteria bacterium]
MRHWAFLLALVTLPALAVERVTDFHSTIEIAADGVLTVRERISVEVEGREIRRGILRDFPTDYRDRFGNRVSVPFDVVSVRRDNSAEPYALERLRNGQRIRIGRSDVLLQYGVHTYEITYRTARQIGHFPDHDELYWNVNGTGWTFSFDHLSAEVLLPRPVPAAELRAEAYTGPQGARGRNYQSLIRDGAVGFTSTAPLGRDEGMTIVVGFPRGIVAEPGLFRRIGWFFSQNQGVAAGLIGFALMLGFLYWRWSEVGRDPEPGPKFPRYQAPDGLGPAAVRFVDRQGYDDKCFASALLGLGSRGALRIENHGAFMLKPTGKQVEPLVGDRSVMALAARPRTLGKTYDEQIQTVRASHQRELQLLYEERAFSKNMGSLAVGFVIGALAVGAMFVLEAPYAAAAVITFLIIATLFAFQRWLPAYSASGRKLEDEIEGLRQYLGVAERDDLARMKAPPKTAEEFSKFLPYAVALDVEKTWADRFVIALGSAAVAQAVSGWYSDIHGGSGFSIGNFTNSVSSLGETIAAASTPPGSSGGSGLSDGGGGGGSSGGGGGGGGGSGW